MYVRNLLMSVQNTAINMRSQMGPWSPAGKFFVELIGALVGWGLKLLWHRHTNTIIFCWACISPPMCPFTFLYCLLWEMTSPCLTTIIQKQQHTSKRQAWECNKNNSNIVSHLNVQHAGTASASQCGAGLFVYSPGGYPPSFFLKPTVWQTIFNLFSYVCECSTQRQWNVLL